VPVWQRIPFSLRVPLLTVALMVMVGFIASQQVLSTLKQVQNDRIRELAELQVEVLSVALGPLVLRNDVWEVYDTLDRAAGQSDNRRMDFAAVAGAEGMILAATDPQRAPVDSSFSAIAQETQSLENLVVTGKVAQIRLVEPLIYQDRNVGQILIELDVSDLLSARQQAALYLLIGNSAAKIGRAHV